MFEKEFHFFMKAMYYSKIIDDIIIAVVLSCIVIWVGGHFLKVKNLYKIIATVIAVILSILIVPIPYKREIEQATEKKIEKYNKAQAQYQAAKAVFDEQCKKAGEKIYRTVDNVDGIMLLKVRYSEYKHANDPMWENAAMYKESTNGFYIHSFFEDKLIDNNGNIYISDNQKTYVGGKLRKNEKYTYFNGYQFVDVQKKDGRIIRYSGKLTSDEIYDKTEPTLSPKIPARYAVTFENDVDPKLRKYWVAGTTIKIIDRQTNELLAEKTIFAFEPGQGSTVTERQPWAFAQYCPEMKTDTETRIFVDKVLQPFQLTPSFNGDEK